MSESGKASRNVAKETLGEIVSKITVAFRGRKVKTVFFAQKPAQKRFSFQLHQIFIRSKMNLLIGDPTCVIGEIQK